MKLAAVLLSAIASAGAAHADAPQSVPQPTVLVGGGFGAVAVTIGTTWVLDAAVLPAPSSPVRVHAMFERGHTGGEDFGAVPFLSARAGIERVACTPAGGFCMVGDLDLGLRHADARDYGAAGNQDLGDHDRNGLLLGARAGLDLGSPQIRFRLMLDISHAVTGSFDVHGPGGDDRDLGTELGIEGELVVGLL